MKVYLTSALIALVSVLAAGCSAPPLPSATDTATATPSATGDPTPTLPSPSPTLPSPFARPEWLGTIPLELHADGSTISAPTPPELTERALEPRPFFVDPVSDEFTAHVSGVPSYVAARSTYVDGCPVPLEDLRYITLTFWGFDGRPHVGEIIVHRSVADDVVEVFHELYDARFPIEEMRVVSLADLQGPATGDGNGSGAFSCRKIVGSVSTWSQHSYGLAIDINPFQNPYVKGEVIIPELAGSYLDREWERPGMIERGDIVVRAFARIGWTWGGTWSSPKDYMHFSLTGR